jgi:hypothetical protein
LGDVGCAAEVASGTGAAGKTCGAAGVGVCDGAAGLSGLPLPFPWQFPWQLPWQFPGQFPWQPPWQFPSQPQPQPLQLSQPPQHDEQQQQQRLWLAQPAWVNTTSNATARAFLMASIGLSPPELDWRIMPENPLAENLRCGEPDASRGPCFGKGGKIERTATPGFFRLPGIEGKFGTIAAAD